METLTVNYQFNPNKGIDLLRVIKKEDIEKLLSNDFYLKEGFYIDEVWDDKTIFRNVFGKEIFNTECLYPAGVTIDALNNIVNLKADTKHQCYAVLELVLYPNTQKELEKLKEKGAVIKTSEKSIRYKVERDS